MKKILGLDLGVASIGWAAVMLSEDDGEILGLGTRVVPLDTDERDSFVKGQPVPTNREKARLKGMRRNLQRYQLRRLVLASKLREWNWLPDETLFTLTAVELYGLRAKALMSDEELKEEGLKPLTLNELGRILLHLNQKRGFKSNRKASSADEQDTEYVQKINTLSNKMRGKGLTPGQYFYQHLKVNPQYKVKTQILPRADYILELEEIWKNQQSKFQNELTDERYTTLKDRIIYYQRRLKSQKGLVGNCPFEKHHKVAPASSPYSQVCAILEKLNTVRFTDKFGEVVLLTGQQRQEIMALAFENEQISKTAIYKVAKLSSHDYRCNYEKLLGFKTRASILKKFKEAGIKDLSPLGFDQLSKEPQPLMELWHLLYATESDEAIVKALQERYQMTPEQARIVAGVGFNAERAGKSTRAIRKLLPHLMEGKLYSEACELCKYNHSNSETKEQKEVRTVAEILELLPKNSMRSPVVEKILNQMIHVVNTAIATYGAFDEIHVEMARELKASAEERDKMASGMKKAEKRNEEIAKLLMENNEVNLKRINSNDILKYRLWIEFNMVSPYEPTYDPVTKKGGPISLAELFSLNSEYEIEHIIPKSRYFDDSFANKTLARREINALKDNQTATDFMAGRKDYNDFVGIVNNTVGLGKHKRKLLLMKGEDIPTDFIARQLAETRFITREATKILGKVCKEIIPTTGIITDKLRHVWGLDNLMFDLNREKLEALGRLEVIESRKRGQEHKEIEVAKKGEWSKREDQRHHALDALVTALCNRSIIQRFNTLNADHKELKHLTYRPYNPPAPIKNLYANAHKALEQVLVSYKGGKKSVSKSINRSKYNKAKNKPEMPQAHLIPRGLLHQDTIYGKGKRLVMQWVNKQFRLEWLPLMHNVKHRAILQERLAEYDNKPAKAFAEPVWMDARQTMALQQVEVWEECYTKQKALDKNFDVEKDLFEIIDPHVRKLVGNHLKRYDMRPERAFAEGIKVWQNESQGIAIQKVTIRARAENLLALRTNEKGELKDFVFKQNNHHAAVYRISEDKIVAEVVSFWDAVQRRKAGQPAIAETHPEHGWPLMGFFQENNMFVIGMTLKELNDSIRAKDWKTVSKYLYRVQNLAQNQNFFRHHLETSVKDKSIAARRYGVLHQLSDQPLKDIIKVQCNHLGHITKVTPWNS